MKIDFYDKNLELQEEIYNWVSIFACNTYNSLGSFSLELVNTPNYSSVVNLWRYLTIDNDNENVYVITTINVTQDSIILKGYSVTYILSKRISTDIVSSENAELAMHRLVKNMSPWDNLEVGIVKGYNDIFNNQISDKTILEYLQNIGQATDMVFKIVKRGKKLFFECYKPEKNINVKYSTSLKNVTNLDYLLSEENYANVAIVAGSGEGENRITEEIALADGTSGIERREIYVDARNAQTNTQPPSMPDNSDIRTYPVGAIYISVSSTSPASLFGGTWERISGRFLIGAGAAEANTTDYWGTLGASDVNCLAGEMGGEATHTLTVNEMPSHGAHLYTSSIVGTGTATSKYLGNMSSYGSVARGWITSASNEYYPAGQYVGGGAKHNNMPPYLAVYMWKRIA